MSFKLQSSGTAGPRTLGRDFLLLALSLLVVLSVLFSPSFQERMALFSNDAPLGLISNKAGVEASTFEGLFTGYWQDSNWIGIEQPSVLPGLSWGLYQIWHSPTANTKVFVPVSLFLLGFAAWVFGRANGFRPVVCLFIALAALLNMNTFSHSCWGLPSRALTLASAFMALAALRSGAVRRPLAKAALAGIAVAMGVTEGFDVGALFSLYVAAYAFFIGFETSTGAAPVRVAKSALRLGVVVLFAGLFAAQTLVTLINTQIVGVAGMEQDAESKAKRWDGATMWSLPKIETLRVLVPGLFGYRMDTGEGGRYWGSVGQSPGVPQSRHSGAGEYAGLALVLAAAFAAASAWRKQGGGLTEGERRQILFWSGMAVIAVLLAWGRHAPFYQILYALPYFSTIRNPIKFMHLFHLCLLILGAFGLELIFRQYLSNAKATTSGMIEHLSKWWSQLKGWDRRWVTGLAAFIGVSVVGWFIYLSSQRDVLGYLEKAGFKPEEAAQIAAFSQHEVVLYLVFLVVTAFLFLLCLSGWLGGQRTKWAGLAFCLLITIDLARSNRPWIIYYDYQEKYAGNPVVDFLRDNTRDSRATAKLSPISQQYLAQGQMAGIWPALANEWIQHHWQYYNVQALDIIQMSHMPALDSAFLEAMSPKSDAELRLFARLWELTATRYIVGQREYIQLLNGQVDGALKRFHSITNFEVLPKPGAGAAGGLRVEDITAQLAAEGHMSLFEFTGALPRLKLYANWQSSTNDSEVLAKLVAPDFDPSSKVWVNGAVPASTSGTNSSGEASFASYGPKLFTVKAKAAAPSILLCNDHWSPNWLVKVDGQPATLLRCNHIMRGVQLPAGEHTIEFRYAPPSKALYLSFATLGLGLLIGAFLVIDARRQSPETA